MNELDIIFEALSKYSNSPLAWLFIPMILLYFVKKYIFAGSWRAVQNILDHYFEEREKHLQSQMKLEEDLRTLAERIKEIAEGLWENRRIINDKIASFEEMQKNTLLGVREILSIIPKRKSDFQPPPA